MKRITAIIVTALMSIALLPCIQITSEAGTVNTIDSVSITLEYDTWYSGDDCDEESIKASVGGPGYVIDNMMMINKPARGWRIGDVPRLQMELDTVEGYIFASSAATVDGVSVNGGEAVSAKLADEHTIMYLYIDLQEVADSGWDVEIEGTNVSGGPVSKAKQTPGTWIKDPVNGWYFVNPNGTVTKNGWQLINGKWYFFNANGFMVANAWVLWKNIYYYCGPDGDMWINRRTPDGYWVNQKGEWVVGAR